MYLLLFALFISPSFAIAPPACPELGRILEFYETDIQKDSIKGCTPDLYKEILKGLEVPNPDYLKGKVCQDLSTIETQVDQMKMELAVLDGIHKLVTSVKDAKEKSQAKKPDVAKTNGQTFVSSLNIAQSVEVLLNATTADGRPLITSLKEVSKTNLMSGTELKERVRELCKDRPTDQKDACNPKLFNPGKEASDEIIALVRNNTINDRQVSIWRDQIAIKRKDKSAEAPAITFTDMQSDLSQAFSKIDSKEVMSKEHLAAIARLDDFEFDDTFSFVKDIKGVSGQKKVGSHSTKFLLLMGDAKQRQAFQVQSKLSIVWEDVKNNVPLSDEQKQQCSNSKVAYDQAVLCFKALEAAQPNVTEALARPKLKEFLPALKTNIDYINALSDKETSCKEELKAKDEISVNCYAEFSRDRAKLMDQIMQLSLVKDKIGAQNRDHMLFRNFALSKWHSQGCDSFTSTVECEDPNLISREASLTIQDSMKIAVLFSREDEKVAKAETNVEPLCRDGSRKRVKHEERMCEFFYENTSNLVKTENAKKDDESAPVAAPDGGNEQDKIRDAWIQGAANILQGTIPAFLQSRANQMTPPYPYNYNPNAYGRPVLGIADSIMANAINGGYTYYRSTPGLAPGTAFPTAPAMSAYTPVGGAAPRFFGY